MSLLRGMNLAFKVRTSSSNRKQNYRKDFIAKEKGTLSGTVADTMRPDAVHEEARGPGPRLRLPVAPGVGCVCVRVWRGARAGSPESRDYSRGLSQDSVAAAWSGRAIGARQRSTIVPHRGGKIPGGTVGFVVQRGCPSRGGGRGGAGGEPAMLRRSVRRALAAAALCVGRSPVSLRAEAAFPACAVCVVCAVCVRSRRARSAPCPRSRGRLAAAQRRWVPRSPRVPAPGGRLSGRKRPGRLICFGLQGGLAVQDASLEGLGRARGLGWQVRAPRRPVGRGWPRRLGDAHVQPHAGRPGGPDLDPAAGGVGTTRSVPLRVRPRVAPAQAPRGSGPSSVALLPLFRAHLASWAPLSAASLGLPGRPASNGNYISPPPPRVLATVRQAR